MKALLWIVQILLACLFLFAGGMKLILPIEQMTTGSPVVFPGWFLRLLGILEVSGALGLVLPWILNIKRGLTPLAACGLVIIMIGATVITANAGLIGVAIFSFVIGVLCAFVAYFRSKQI